MNADDLKKGLDSGNEAGSERESMESKTSSSTAQESGSESTVRVRVAGVGVDDLKFVKESGGEKEYCKPS